MERIVCIAAAVDYVNLGTTRVTWPQVFPGCSHGKTARKEVPFAALVQSLLGWFIEGAFGFVGYKTGALRKYGWKVFVPSDATEKSKLWPSSRPHCCAQSRISSAIKTASRTR